MLQVIISNGMVIRHGVIFGKRAEYVSESMVSNTELNEFFAPRWVPGSELSEFP